MASNFSAELGSSSSITGRMEGSTCWRSVWPVGPRVGEGKLHGILAMQHPHDHSRSLPNSRQLDHLLFGKLLLKKIHSEKEENYMTLVGNEEFQLEVKSLSEDREATVPVS